MASSLLLFTFLPIAPVSFGLQVIWSVCAVTVLVCYNKNCANGYVTWPCQVGSVIHINSRESCGSPCTGRHVALRGLEGLLTVYLQ